MELNQVRYFITLCGMLNFTRAAEQCNISQPAFTRSIHKLEDEFGGQLIFRDRNHTRLTELGRAVRPHLQSMLDAAEAANALANAKRTRTTASLKIGLGPGIGAANVARAVREIVNKLPDVIIHFEESYPADLVEAMLTDRLDCALVPEDYGLSERMNRWPLYSDRAIVVLPPDHRLLSKTVVDIQDVIDETILVGDLCGDFANRLAKITSHSFRLQRCNGGTSRILDLIGVGAGIALLSDRLPFAPPLIVRPLQSPELLRSIFLITVAGRPLNPAAVGFVNLCRTQNFA